MKINRLTNDLGDFRCFEIDNTTVSRNGVAKVVAKLADVKVTHFPRFYDDEVFCEFELNSHKFEVMEPYGDSTTYDIIAPDGQLPEMELIADHFEKSAPIKGGDLDKGYSFYCTGVWVLQFG